MKHITSLWFLLLVLNSTFFQAGILVSYMVDIEGYTEAFCENTDKPEMQCHGKCHLTKMLAESEENKQENKELPPPEKFAQVYLPVRSEDREPNIPETQHRISFHYFAELTDGAYHTVFHPPKTRTV